MSQLALIDVPAHNGSDDENWRFTSPEALHWLLAIAGVERFDLDPFACHEAHLAERYYTLERGEDGYSLPWLGAVGYNPPWDNIEQAIRRSWATVAYGDCGVVAALLPLRTHMGWWRRWVAPFRDKLAPAALPDFLDEARRKHWPELEMHEAPKRFAYGGPGNPRAIGVAEPNFQSVGLVWRRA